MAGVTPGCFCSALVFYFSDGWNGATGGFTRASLGDGPQARVLRLICKPSLFWGKKTKTQKDDERRLFTLIIIIKNPSGQCPFDSIQSVR